ncbi:MAG: hypothetical protein U9O83_07910, partial [Campylobacterota bacterium]|nr:hypothetical protein [Campylobacterota bacterium]
DIGDKPNHREDITSDELIAEYKKLKEYLGKKSLTQSDMNKKGKFSSSTYERRFGSWNKFLKHIGDSPNINTDISKKDLLNDYHRIGEKIGKVTPVLKKEKNNRPRTMLHLELYESGKYTKPKEWVDDKPDGLLSPLILFKKEFEMEYPSQEVYEFMYKKYIEKDTKYSNSNFLLKEFDYKDKSILDLCGGAGYVSEYMLNQEVKEIDYFDQSNIMIHERVKTEKKINKFYGDVQTQLPNKKYAPHI